MDCEECQEILHTLERRDKPLTVMVQLSRNNENVAGESSSAAAKPQEKLEAPKKPQPRDFDSFDEYETALAEAALIERDPVNHPAHYNSGRIEPIAVIEDWRLGFHEGNVLKYLARAPYKGQRLEDLKKARWYLDRIIAQLETAK
jgi:hypothetical protein